MEAKEVEGDRGCWVEMERRKFHTISIFKELYFLCGAAPSHSAVDDAYLLSLLCALCLAL